MIQEKSKVTSWVGGIIATLCIAGITLFVYDLLFSKPAHISGIIIEKIFVPAHTYSGGPYGGNRRGNYTITTAQEEQWIAIVRTDKGDTLKVHCIAMPVITKALNWAALSISRSTKGIFFMSTTLLTTKKKPTN